MVTYKCGLNHLFLTEFLEEEIHDVTLLMTVFVFDVVLVSKLLCCCIIFYLIKVNACVFEDVPENAWYRPYVISAYENGVISGVSDIMFGTGQNLTREQMVTIAYNAALKAGIKFNEQAHYVPFADDKVVEEYAETALHILAGNGIINGKEENMFMPKESCTRAEAAKVLYGVYLANYR